MKRSYNLLKYPMHVFRGLLIQPFFWALFFLSPVLNVFRVDMIHLQLVVMGKNLPFEFNTLMWLPIGFYGGVILISVITFLWGRLFCGWSCPHNTLTEWTRPLRAMVKREEKPRWMKLLIRRNVHMEELMFWLSPIFGLVLVAVFSLLLCFYIVPPDWVGAQYASGKPHIALLFGNGLFVLIGLFLLYAGHDFCRTCCPYGMGQSISAYHEFSRWRPMEVRFTGDSLEECNSCTVCRQVCPVDIDPRKPENLVVGQFDGCFNCGECIDACHYIHDFKQQPGLLDFGSPGFRTKEALEKADHPKEPKVRRSDRAYLPSE